MSEERMPIWECMPEIPEEWTCPKCGENHDVEDYIDQYNQCPDCGYDLEVSVDKGVLAWEVLYNDSEKWKCIKCGKEHSLDEFKVNDNECPSCSFTQHLNEASLIMMLLAK